MERFSGEVEGDFVVFLIGMKVRKWWRPDAYVATFASMLPMLRELGNDSSIGLLGTQSHGTTVVQYWRSVEDLNAFAQDPKRTHRPAWLEFYRKMAKVDEAVGIWHETFQVRAGEYEAVYVNMPGPFGLGKAGTREQGSGSRADAEGRMRRNRQTAAAREHGSNPVAR